MSVLKIGNKYWYSSGAMHFNKNDAISVKNKCIKKGVKAKLVKRNMGGDPFWMIYIDSNKDWLCDIDKAWGE